MAARERRPRRRRALAQKLALAVCSVVVILGGLEVALRIFLPQPTKYFHFKRSYEPGAQYTIWGDVEVRINAHGQRDYERTLDKPAGVCRIALLGDSVAFGFGVPIEESYAKRLEGRLNRGTAPCRGYEVLSFTNGGNGPLGYLQMLRDDALRFEPDLVLVGFTLNDFELPRGRRSARQRLYAGMRAVHSRMRVWSHLYHLLLERSRGWLYRSGLLDKSVTSSLALASLETRGERFQEAWRFTRGNLDEIRGLSSDAGARFAMVVFPLEMQLNPQLLDLYRTEYRLALSDAALEGRPQSLLADYGAANGFVTVDLLEPFRVAAAEGRPLYFREFGGALDFVHPNSSGHQLAAEVLFERLRQSDLLSPAAADALR